MLPSTFTRSKAGRCLPVLLAALIFAGCTPRQTPDQSAVYLQGKTAADSAFYLQQMQQSADDSKTNWQLLAIRALLKEGQPQQALALYNQLPQELNDLQHRELALLKPEVKIAQQDYAAAATLLNNIEPSSLDAGQQNRYYQAVIDASQGQPSLKLLRAYIARQPLLSPEEQQKNIDGIWQALTQITPQQMNSLVINADENVLQGWLDLQRVWSENRNNTQMLEAGIKEWQIRYPNNPGAKMLPTQLTSLQTLQPASTNKIALLLPLSGQAAVFGRTIQQGFEAAKNNGSTPVASLNAAPTVDTLPQTAQIADAHTVASPADAAVSDLTGQPPTQHSPQLESAAPQPAAAANPAAEIKIYDTGNQSLEQALAQARQDGATMVVGPLLKNNVDQLANSNSPLNILALNQPEQVQDRPNICYFALSPENEARDAAAHIWQQNHRTPLLLVPYGSFGERISKAFATEWQKLGGSLVLQQKFGSVSDLKHGINSGAGISLSGTPVSLSATTQPDVDGSVVALPTALMESQGAVAGNVDAVYIIATPDELGLIKPMIAMRTGSRSSAQLYASSRSAGGANGPDFRLEMDGLQFSEIPMLSGGNPQLMQQALSSVGNDYSLARLYAMGVDAWSLANSFTQMRQTPGFQLNGNTGQLSASQDCVINRKLNWLQFNQGQIVPAT